MIVPIPLLLLLRSFRAYFVLYTVWQASHTNAKVAIDTPGKMWRDYRHIHQMQSVQKPEKTKTQPEFFYISIKKDYW